MTANTCAVCGTAQAALYSYCLQCGSVMPGLGTGLLQTGLILQGRYQIVRKLGQGGMGAVYEVVDQRLGGKRMALKEMSDIAITDLQERARAIAAFEQEAQMLARLKFNHSTTKPRLSLFSDSVLISPLQITCYSI